MAGRTQAKEADTGKAEGGYEAPVVISVDNRISEVVELDKLGKQLAFRDDIGRFLQLGETVVEKLEAKNRQAYFLAKTVWQSRQDEQFDAVVSASALNSGTPADRKLRVEGRSDLMYHYYRPEEVDDMRMLGWKVSQGGVKTFRGNERGTVQITREGRQEMILMEVPRDRMVASRKAQDKAIEAWTNGQLPSAINSELNAVAEGTALTGREQGNMSPIAKAESE